ncbi:hypothetical protein B0J14DRAFT_247633 [Halenospora varia]|nr:hypothetical protein B0J14DRAFT_247633 [Halenospora varia]
MFRNQFQYDDTYIHKRPRRSDFHIPDFAEERAWMLQEAVLAPRNIVYTAGYLLWTCNSESVKEMRASEPQSSRYSLHNGSQVKLLFHLFTLKAAQTTLKSKYVRTTDLVTEHSAKMSDTLDDEDELVSDQSFLHWWYSVSDSYINRKISFPRDQLPGIAGTSREFASRCSYQYICGLWREDLVHGLCWNGYGARIKTAEYLGPSWSWISISSNLPGQRRSTFHHVPSDVYERVPGNDVEVIKVLVVNENDDLYGQVKSGVIVLKSVSIELRSLKDAVFIDSSDGQGAGRFPHHAIEITLDEQPWLTG